MRKKLLEIEKESKTEREGGGGWRERESKDIWIVGYTDKRVAEIQVDR